MNADGALVYKYSTTIAVITPSITPNTACQKPIIGTVTATPYGNAGEYPISKPQATPANVIPS